MGKDQGIVPQLKLRLATENLTDAEDVAVRLNGRELVNGVLDEDWLEYAPKPRWLRHNIGDIHRRT